MAKKLTGRIYYIGPTQQIPTTRGGSAPIAPGLAVEQPQQGQAPTGGPWPDHF